MVFFSSTFRRGKTTATSRIGKGLIVDAGDLGGDLSPDVICLRDPGEIASFGFNSLVGTRAGTLTIYGRYDSDDSWHSLIALTIVAGVLFDDGVEFPWTRFNEFKIEFVDSTAGVGAGALTARYEVEPRLPR